MNKSPTKKKTRKEKKKKKKDRKKEEEKDIVSNSCGKEKHVDIFLHRMNCKCRNQATGMICSSCMNE